MTAVVDRTRPASRDCNANSPRYPQRRAVALTADWRKYTPFSHERCGKRQDPRCGGEALRHTVLANPHKRSDLVAGRARHRRLPANDEALTRRRHYPALRVGRQLRGNRKRSPISDQLVKFLYVSSPIRNGQGVRANDRDTWNWR